MAISLFQRNDGWQNDYLQMMNDLQFLMLRAEEEPFIRDKMAEIRYRRAWVEEREACEKARRKG